MSTKHTLPLLYSEQNKDESLASLLIDEWIEKADGLPGVFPGTTMQIAYFYYSCLIGSTILQHL
jgi:hypothetical protein